MSRENVEIVRSIFIPWENGDFSSVEWADADIAFATPKEGNRAVSMRCRACGVIGLRRGKTGPHCPKSSSRPGTACWSSRGSEGGAKAVEPRTRTFQVRACSL